MATTTPEGAQRAVAKFPRDVGKGLEEAQRDLLQKLEREARGRASSGQAGAASRALKIEAGEPPLLTFSAGSQVTATARADELFWGSEFGGGGRPTTLQFPPWQPSGYWLSPAIRRLEADLLDPAHKAVLEAWRKVCARA